MALKIFQQKSGKILEMLYPGGECMEIHCTTHSSFCNLEYLPNMCNRYPWSEELFHKCACLMFKDRTLNIMSQVH